jgi:hypothetical protein
MATRNSHVGRTTEQKRNYVEAVVRGRDQTATAPTSLGEEGSSTDAPLFEPDREITTQPSRRRPPVRQLSWWEKNWLYALKVVGGGIVTLVIMGVGGVVSLTVINLNRDVGVLHEKAQNTSERIADMRESNRRSEETFVNEFRRLKERLDELRDRVLGRGARK